MVKNLFLVIEYLYNNMDNKDLIAQFKLPSYIKGKSFADASKIITKKFEGRNDKTSLDTKKELLNRLAQAQESLKPIEQPQQEFEEGGWMEQNGDRLGAGITGGLNLATSMFSQPNIDTSGVAPSAEVNTGASITGGLATGASAGAALGPLGAGIGAVVGGIGGLINSRKAKKAAFKNTNNYAINQNNAVSDQYAEGGPIDPPGSVYNTKNIVDYQPGVISGKDGSSGFYLYSKSRSDKGFDVNKDREYVKNVHMGDVQRTPQWQSYMKNKVAKDTFTKNPITEYAKGGVLPKLDPLNLSPIGLQDVKGSSIADYNFEGAAVPKSLYEKTLKDKIKIGLQDTSEKVLDYAGENYSTALRMAPAVANALQLKNLKKPDGVRLNRLNNKYKPSYTNLGQQQAIADQELNNVSRAIQQSGASQGAIRNNLLGAQLNKTKALSTAYNNAENYNNQQDSYAQQFNLNIDQANLSQANMEQDINDRNKGAYDTQKSQLISQVGKDIGNIGKEQWFKKYPKMMGLGYNFDGKYFTNKDGDKKTIEEAEALETTQKANGGILNKDVLNHINTMYTKRNKK